MIEYFNQMKADLLETYKADLCEESVEAINQAGTMAEFIGLLGKFSAFLNYKEIPTIDWVKNWFNTSELRKIANDNGVYFDGIVVITNPTKYSVLMGNVKAVLTCAEPHLYQLTIQDNSELEIATFCNCSVRVRKKGNAKCSTITKNPYSRIKILSI